MIATTTTTTTMIIMFLFLSGPSKIAMLSPSLKRSLVLGSLASKPTAVSRSILGGPRDFRHLGPGGIGLA
jgi:hypothetical protein